MIHTYDVMGREYSMKTIIKKIKLLYWLPDDFPDTPCRLMVIWYIWIVLVFLVFSKLMTGHMGSREAAMIGLMGCGLFPGIYVFNNTEYVVSRLKKECNNLIGLLYIQNCSWMLIKLAVSLGCAVFLYPGEITENYIIVRSTFFAYWFLSIPLTLVSSPLWLILWIEIVTIVSGSWYLVLKYTCENMNGNRFILFFLAMGWVIIAGVASYAITYIRMKRLFY